MMVNLILGQDSIELEETHFVPKYIPQRYKRYSGVRVREGAEEALLIPMICTVAQQMRVRWHC